MPTLVAALTLVALLKLSMVDLPRWHLAFWFCVLVTLALFGSMPRSQAILNGVGSFAAAWLYFVLLDHTDNTQDRALHWLILIGGFVLLIASRLYIDIRVYGISF
ncbi:MAG: response regulator [Gammaproteobacteria bacterium]|nr:response regulator [Gammaproteobacteria bacterium]MBU2122037.1 response regulator [Gammaproteobacteria bacterium]MBU2170052.1 response regulator [Gammaproteobacteria bacterium]MBU2202612.1 response regulator [Gammaproteobacteria bacterium]MBU2276352.1 response regulator [Gammaproteobacteria bacterium]